MAQSIEKVKLRFLESAACSLSTAAPAISAHLMIHKQTEAAKHVLKDYIRKEASTVACSACGTLLIPGLTCENTIEQSRSSEPHAPRPRSRRGATKRKEQKYLVVKCLKCHRFRKHRIEKSQSADIKKPVSTSNTQLDSTESGVAIEPKIISRNASSRQRAKSRRGGLETLLKQQQKPTKADSTALDLMDFMKEG